MTLIVAVDCYEKYDIVLVALSAGVRNVEGARSRLILIDSAIEIIDAICYMSLVKPLTGF